MAMSLTRLRALITDQKLAEVFSKFCVHFWKKQLPVEMLSYV
jgi:hypothetical protein